MIASERAKDNMDWNDIDFDKFLNKMAVAAETAKSQMNITKMMPLITNQARYAFTQFTMDLSSQKTVDMYQYQTQVAGKNIIITCLAYDDTIDEEKAFFDQVMDSIWYDGVDSIYGPAPTASGKSQAKAVTTDVLSLKIPNTWSAKQLDNMEFSNGYIHLFISSADAFATFSEKEKQGSDRNSFDFEGIAEKYGLDSLNVWAKQFASDFETNLSATSISMGNLLGMFEIKTFGISDSMLTMVLDNSVNFDDGTVIKLGGKPSFLLTGKVIMTGENEHVMVRLTQDIRLYYNLYNGYSNMLQFSGEMREDAAREMKKVLGTVKFE